MKLFLKAKQRSHFEHKKAFPSLSNHSHVVNNNTLSSKSVSHHLRGDLCPKRSLHNSPVLFESTHRPSFPQRLYQKSLAKDISSFQNNFPNNNINHNNIQKNPFHTSKKLKFSNFQGLSPTDRKPEKEKFASQYKTIIYGFGNSQQGQLLSGGPKVYLVPQNISKNKCENIRFKNVIAGWHAAFGLAESGELYGWGTNEFSPLGLGRASPVPFSFSRIPIDQKISKVCSGRVHSLFLTETGEVYSCGFNDYGQCGVGNDQAVTTPTKVKGLDQYQISHISCGLDHSFALTSCGKVFSWGWNAEGQLGLNHCDDVNEPSMIQSLHQNGFKIVDLDAGFDSGAVITEEGNLLTFGINELGQLGLGHNLDRDGPETVKNFADKIVIATAQGGQHALFYTTEPNLYSCGMGTQGQLGDGRSVSSNEPEKPIPFFEGEELDGMDAGGGFSLVSHQQRLYSWGFGEWGRLGLGDEEDRDKPTEIEFFRNKQIIDFSCGVDFALVLVKEPVIKLHSSTP